MTFWRIWLLWAGSGGSIEDWSSCWIASTCFDNFVNVLGELYGSLIIRGGDEYGVWVGCCSRLCCSPDCSASTWSKITPSTNSCSSTTRGRKGKKPHFRKPALITLSVSVLSRISLRQAKKLFLSRGPTPCLTFWSRTWLWWCFHCWKTETLRGWRKCDVCGGSRTIITFCYSQNFSAE